MPTLSTPTLTLGTTTQDKRDVTVAGSITFDAVDVGEMFAPAQDQQPGPAQQGPGQGDDRAGDLALLARLADPADERAVDLEHVDRQALEVAEG